MIKKIKVTILSIFTIFPIYGYSAIEINKNRFIFIESQNQEVIEIKNKTDNNYFIQAGFHITMKIMMMNYLLSSLHHSLK